MRKAILLGLLIGICALGPRAHAADWGEITRGNTDRKEVCLTLDGGGMGNDAFLMDKMMDALEPRHVRLLAFPIR